MSKSVEVSELSEGAFARLVEIKFSKRPFAGHFMAISICHFKNCGIILRIAILTLEGTRLCRLKLSGARIETLEFPRVIFLRKYTFWVPKSIDSGQSVDPESKLKDRF